VCGVDRNEMRNARNVQGNTNRPDGDPKGDYYRGSGDQKRHDNKPMASNVFDIPALQKPRAVLGEMLPPGASNDRPQR
jgi:hypothetical protein